MSYKDKILFGAAYYDEYQPVSRLDEDIKMMKQANFNVIRVGEGSWSHWEPEDNKFNLDWLQPILDKAYENGISAIIGVPTFAIPQWLVRKYPEVALHDINGNPHYFGSREEHSLSHPVFKYYSHRVINKIVNRYKDHPAVIGWQLHNEPGLFLNYSHDVFEGFKDYLRHKYTTVQNLNKQWGLVYWSHELSTWDDLWKPEGNAQPQYDIEWRRYQAKLTDNLLKWQHDLIRSKIPKKQFITVNLALGRDALDEAKSSKHLDIASSDLYYLEQDGLKLPNPAEPKAWFTVGPWQLTEQADRSYSVKQMPFCVAETDGGPIGGAGDNYPAYPGQLRQAGWAFVSRGARMIEYWHWQQLHYGTETYWGGILPHDRKAGRIYQEITALGKDFTKAGKQVVDLKPDEDLAMLYSVKSRWGLSFEPYHAANAMNDPHKTRNPQAYDHLFNAFYAGAFLANKQVHIIQDEQIYNDEKDQVQIKPIDFVAKHPVLLVVGAYITSDHFLDWLKDYVAYGGHLILGPRTAYADDLGRARLLTKPAGLTKISGATYQEFSNLQQPLQVKGNKDLIFSKKAYATEWIDMLRPTNNTNVLANYCHPFFGHYPMITENQVEKGKVTMIGTVPNHQLAKEIFTQLLPDNGWHLQSDHVTHSSAVNYEGIRFHFIFNWSWDSTTIQLPNSMQNILTGNQTKQITLKPWDVVILKEV